MVLQSDTPNILKEKQWTKGGKDFTYMLSPNAENDVTYLLSRAGSMNSQEKDRKHIGEEGGFKGQWLNDM